MLNDTQVQAIVTAAQAVVAESGERYSSPEAWAKAAGPVQGLWLALNGAAIETHIPACTRAEKTGGGRKAEVIDLDAFRASNPAFATLPDSVVLAFAKAAKKS